MTKWICTRSDELYHHGIKGQKWERIYTENLNIIVKINKLTK